MDKDTSLKTETMSRRERVQER